METIPVVIQIIGLTGATLFMLYIFRLIVRGQLREEYSIVWILCTIILIVFSIWRRGLEQISLALGVFYPPSLIFLAAIFAIIIFLVHLSVVVSRLQNHIKTLTHELAYLKQEVAMLKENSGQAADGPPILTES
ncbi:DUF2304 domain-containing protein [Spirosoma montaniterrae]|uniref:DUF2304 domain-containing protein n=1 Tax=Spirosoma montaniterrae TaxID=1178516 RepID=A0A1P9X1S3_9BACT|nr:DUF2304 domain-containing protein [Spirosoma montaniterrae]AQG81584.1 hypothetical protein AWR27_21095 [Spirosoma montaniterrae]